MAELGTVARDAFLTAMGWEDPGAIDPNVFAAVADAVVREYAAQACKLRGTVTGEPGMFSPRRDVYHAGIAAQLRASGIPEDMVESAANRILDDYPDNVISPGIIAAINAWEQQWANDAGPDLSNVHTEHLSRELHDRGYEVRGPRYQTRRYRRPLWEPR